MAKGDLERIKGQYAVLQKKYKLPSFDELNNDFDIEKLQERESDHLLKLVRMTIIEKVAAIVRFLEVFLNPSEAPTPLFIYALLKNTKIEVRKEIEVLYKELSRVELSSISLDIDHDEKEEAIFVAEFYKMWLRDKTKLKEITMKLGMNWNKDSKVRNYLG